MHAAEVALMQRSDQERIGGDKIFLPR